MWAAVDLKHRNIVDDGCCNSEVLHSANNVILNFGAEGCLATMLSHWSRRPWRRLSESRPHVCLFSATAYFSRGQSSVMLCCTMWNPLLQRLCPLRDGPFLVPFLTWAADDGISYCDSITTNIPSSSSSLSATCQHYPLLVIFQYQSILSFIIKLCIHIIVTATSIVITLYTHVCECLTFDFWAIKISHVFECLIFDFWAIKSILWSGKSASLA